MLQRPRSSHPFQSVFVLAELIYHEIVKNVRGTHSNAILALVNVVMMNVVLIAVFYVFSRVMGLRASPIRGNYFLYIMSGVFMYMTFVRAVGSVAGAPQASATMMMHAPMNTFVAISSAALSALYTQLLSMGIILFAIYTLIEPFTIHDPLWAMGILLLCWFSGLSIGMIFYALTPWFPGFTSLANLIFVRINMIASGKMFVVNTLPAHMVSLFDWNPLFHVIDQQRGAIFSNYFPRVTNLEYPFWLAVAFLAVGLLGKFYTGKYVSSSWSARTVN